jgi:PAS domain S-box-containing protein
MPFDLVQRLRLYFLICTVVPFALVGIFIYRLAQEQIVRQAEAQVSSEDALWAQLAEAWVRQQEHILEQVLISPQWQGYFTGRIDSEGMNSFLEHVVQVHSGVSESLLIDVQTGDILAATNPDLLGENVFSWPFFQKGREQFYVQGVYWPPSMDRMVMTISGPVRDEYGKARDVLAFHLNLGDLAAAMSKQGSLGLDGQGYLVTRAGTRITGEELRKGFTFEPTVSTVAVEKALAGGSGTARYVGPDGRPVIGAYRWLPELQLALIVERSEDRVLGRLERFTALLLSVLGLALLGANLGLYVVSRRLMAPVSELAHAARQVASGNLDVRVAALARGGEIGTLIDTFNAMLDDLRRNRADEERHLQEIEQANRQLTALLDTARAISGELELDRLLEEIVQQAISVIPDAESGILLLWDGQSFVPRVISGSGNLAVGEQGVQVRPLSEWTSDLAPATELLTQGEVCCLTRGENVPGRFPITEAAVRHLEVLGLPNAQAILLAPVLAQGLMVGLIALINCRTAEAFGSRARRMANLLAAQAAVAIVNAQLFEQARREREQFRSLYEASLDVAASLDLADVLRATLRRAVENTGARNGGIFIVDEEENLVRHLTMRHDYQGDSLCHSLLTKVYPQGLAGWVVRQRKPALVEDTDRDPRWVPLEVPEFPSLRSAAVVPLIHQNQVLGGLSLVDSKPGHFRPEHLELLTGLATQAASAIANARLFSQASAARRDWETTFDAIDDGVVIVDVNGFVLQANRAFAGYFDMHPRDLVGEHLPPLIFESGESPEDCPVIRTLRTGETSRGELSGGAMLVPGTFDIAAYPRHDDEGDLVGVVSIWRDVTAEREIQARARWLEELNQGIVENARDIIYAHDLDGNFLFINRRAEDLLGYTLQEALRLNIRDLVVPEQIEQEMAGMRAPRGSVIPPHEVTVVAKDGSRINLEVSATPLVIDDWVVGVAGVARDLREIRRLEQRLLQAEKLSALGQLVAGVAHELNNPLTAVIGFAQLLQNADVDDRTRESLRRINTQAERAAQIVRNLLAFARQQEPHREMLNVNDVICETLRLVEYDWKTQNIEIEAHLEPALPWIVADRQQLQQVFLNLFQNAYQAMTSAHGRGTLTIRTREITLQAEPEGMVERRIRVEVQDDGPGMPEEVLTHVFDPFFTTKDVGEGTGLGLSICYGTVQEQGGTIWAESTLGQGSTFCIEWPVEAVSQASREERAVSPSGPRPRVFPPARVLVVEDEEMLAELLRITFAECGHAVEVAGDGREALRLLAGTRFDFVVSDIKMPGMDGKEFYRQIRARHPDLLGHLLFITGDTVSPDTAHFLDETGIPVLAKPFRTSELLEMMQRLGWWTGRGLGE